MRGDWRTEQNTADQKKQGTFREPSLPLRPRRSTGRPDAAARRQNKTHRNVPGRFGLATAKKGSRPAESASFELGGGRRCSTADRALDRCVPLGRGVYRAKGAGLRHGSVKGVRRRRDGLTDAGDEGVTRKQRLQRERGASSVNAGHRKGAKGTWRTKMPREGVRRAWSKHERGWREKTSG